MSELRVTVRDFARRTRRNLLAIQRLSESSPNDFFEVTQLVNSAVGLLMFPQQEFFDRIPEWDNKDLEAKGWPFVSFEHGADRTRNLRQLIRYMRNSFAHFNIDFKADGGKISGLYMWNRPSEGTPPDWVCYLTVDQLRGLFEKFAQLMIEEANSSFYNEIGIKQIRSEIAKSRR